MTLYPLLITRYYPSMSILNFWKKQQKQNDSNKAVAGHMTWEAQAETALNQSVSQAPVPAVMRSMLKSQLKASAEEAAKHAGRTNVTAEDLMAGLMSKLPANMKNKVANALKKGPAGLADLQKEFKK